VVGWIAKTQTSRTRWVIVVYSDAAVSEISLDARFGMLSNAALKLADIGLRAVIAVRLARSQIVA